MALVAGAMIIPAVYVFSGTEGMSAGPSLMFISLPKVFSAMGKAGIVVGIAFFVSAIFATLTSCISVLESIVANCMEIFHTEREKTVKVLTVVYLVASAVISLGYSIFYLEIPLPNGTIGQLLVTLYLTQDSFGTAANVSGDNAIAVVVDEIYHKYIVKRERKEEIA